MNIIKKILSFIFNPIVNIFSIDSTFFDKHHIFLWILTLICVIGLMLVVYMLL